jgi:DNA-directed RNA polymerase I, II, and III subunit RPABC2
MTDNKTIMEGTEDNLLNDQTILDNEPNMNNDTEVMENDTDESDTDFDEDEDEETLFKKLSSNVKSKTSELLLDYHHEMLFHNEDEVRKMTTIVRNEEGDIVDELHKTIPIMTKYERTRILGQRCRQLQNGSIPFVDISRYGDEILDDHFIATLELEQKKIPFIIRRPLPNGMSEYWNARDLELL